MATKMKGAIRRVSNGIAITHDYEDIDIWTVHTAHCPECGATKVYFGGGRVNDPEQYTCECGQTLGEFHKS